MDDTTQGVHRRGFLRGGAGLVAGAAAFGALEALGARVAGAAPVPAATAAAAAGRRWHPKRDAGYGPLAPVEDRTTGLELLKLPAGFEYLTFGWTSDVMGDGRPTPDRHDGMGAFRLRNGNVALVRNHERGSLDGAFAADMTYDPMATGGTTTLVFDPDRGRLVDSYASLAGTIRN